LEDSYANSSAPEPTLSHPRTSKRQFSGKQITTSKLRESPYATSKEDSEAWTPTTNRPITQVSSPSAVSQGNKEGVKEAEPNVSSPSEHSIVDSTNDSRYQSSAILTDVPQEDPSPWLSRSYDLPFPDNSESSAAFNEPHLQSIELQNEISEESDYWPCMTVQEAYLMRYFIDKLACWVSLPSLTELRN
jgi:hypothetical protein